MLFYIFADNFLNISVLLQTNLSSYREKHDGYFVDKSELNFALSLIPKRGKNAPSIYPALKVPILIRNDSLTSEEPIAKAHLQILYV